MASKSFSSFLPEHTWVFEVSPSSNMSQFLAAEEEGDLQDESRLVVPEVIGILPVRNAVSFPGTVVPLAVGRERSIKVIESAAPDGKLIGLLAQLDPDTDHPAYDDLYEVGTIANVLKVIKMPQGTVHVVVHSLVRFEIEDWVTDKPYLQARIKTLESQRKNTKKAQALTVSVRQMADRVIGLSPNVPEEASVLLENIEDPSSLADFLAANLNISTAEKQELLEELNVTRRLEKVSIALQNQLEVLELSHKIQGKVRDSVDKSQREFYLQEQLKAIEQELGQGDSQDEEIKEIKRRILEAEMPETVEVEAMRELDRLAMIPPVSPEYTVIRTYLDWVCELPWSLETEDRLDIARAQRILNRDHFDLEKVKKRILEFLAVRKLNPTGKSPILCFVGPPGVGKTSLGKSIARAMGRKFIRISLGGIRDEADIRGHRRTYIGALPGRVLQELRKVDSRNPVFMLDELDKIGNDFRGDPASALLEVLDPEQNNTFTDHYIDQPFDLSDVMFIGTANYTGPIPLALFDRMEVIELPGYTETDKLNIAKKYLVPRQLKENGLKKTQLKFKDEALLEVINAYTREAGVRNLERNIAALCRSIATEIAKGTKRSATITRAMARKILGPERFESELALRSGIAGVATALAYTPVGGELLFVESAVFPGKGNLVLTGQIGDVMKESAQAAFTVVKANSKKLSIDPEKFTKFDYHIHVPAGAIPKDGPSAGVAVYTSLVSLLLGKATRPDVAMTGEITLRGLVLPIGGLKEKVLAAKRAGIKTIILPVRNKKDVPEIPARARKGLKFKYAKTLDDVLKNALPE